MEMPRLLPVVDDIDTRGFFDAARSGEVAIRMCNGCDAVLHMPRAYCHYCGSWDGRWQTVAGRGTVYSWTVVEHRVHPAFPVPYTILLVELDDLPGTRLMGHLAGAPAVSVGQRVEAWFETLDEDGAVVLPQWRLL
jgi:uncharacterized OB-fold protein